MATMFPCPNCGGQLRYHPIGRHLKCQSCGEYTKVEEYKPDEKISADTVNTKIYTCPTCNGEIQLIDNDGMEFCPFCGNQATMQEHFSSEGAPKYVMPFMLDKKMAKEHYVKATAGIHYAPDGLNDDENVEKLVGLYTPYYLYDYAINKDVSYDAKKTETTYDYYITYKADVKVKFHLDHLKIPFDGSQALDDDIAEKLEPFPMAKLEPFNPNYLAGFFVENSTVDKELYKDDSRVKATDYLTFNALKQSGEYTPDSNVKRRLKNEFDADLQYHETEGAYLPLYFMTTRYGDRVAYSIINGATGQTYCDMPIEKRKMFAAGAVTSLIIFAVIIVASFLLSFSFNVKTLCLFGAFMSSIIALIGAKLANKTYRSDNHLDDKGYYMNEANLDAEHKQNGKKEYYADKIKKNSKNPAANILNTLGFSIACIFFVFCLEMVMNGGDVFDLGSMLNIGLTNNILVSIVLYLITGGILIGAFAKVGKGKKKVMLLGTLGWVCAVLIRVINNPSDIFYYGALIIVFAILIISVNAIVDEYNESATHPSPHFERKGGRLENARD